MTLEHIITGIIYLIIGGVGLVLFRKFFPSKDTSDPMDYSTKYHTLKKAAEKREEEKINAAKKASFNSLVDFLRDELRNARDRDRNKNDS